MSQNSLVSTNADGTGNGGNIDVTADRMRLLSNSQLVANANGSGDAGNIVVNSAQSLYLSQSQITAAGGQGNLALAAPVILLRNNSLVATDARGTAAGGNIGLDADFLIALDNSDITANAQQSFGGRVVVNARSIVGTDYRLVRTPKSDISASSEIGPELSGTVELNTLDVDLTQGLVELPSSFSDSRDNVVGACRVASETNALIMSGRGGTPSDPTQTLSEHSTWADFRPIADGHPIETDRELNKPVEAQSSSLPLDAKDSVGMVGTQAIVEAQSVAINKEGQVTLLASAVQPQLSHSPFCEGVS
ncbi:MAG: S-layer family protein [Phormidesmis sp. RL_2_1]|nr:S-layer family protein [Phormidesmis sp. RL_2_1]